MIVKEWIAAANKNHYQYLLNDGARENACKVNMNTTFLGISLKDKAKITSTYKKKYVVTASDFSAILRSLA